MALCSRNRRDAQRELARLLHEASTGLGTVHEAQQPDLSYRLARKKSPRFGASGEAQGGWRQCFRRPSYQKQRALVSLRRGATVLI
jgi:hypothetical protein